MGPSLFFSGCKLFNMGQDEEELFPIQQPHLVSVRTQAKLIPNPALKNQTGLQVYIYLLPSVTVFTLATVSWNRLTNQGERGGRWC